ncbi:hypothetical protein Ancab_033379 [Ancistrocladus abbreviatus]
MASKQETQRSDLLALQRERERERRRLRDRQRRQNMSQEQKEEHLARRRRNYRLRRIRAENAKLNHQQQDHIIAIPALNNGVAPAVAHVGLCKLGSTAQDLEDGAHLRNFPRRLRLHQIRQLARTMNNPVVLRTDDSSYQNGAELSAQRSSSTNSGLIRRLRLIHVKRLARALNATVLN